ncbi:bifunctional UDP-N-acetylglucosamine diphosphorylase/glucosamine-1-phosphate N-acetyltransferase GlmU [Kocuria sp.]|uniref:bifunctional UDP-N-acetylglucosamine diphosphorylase/glucosamine-1-phosphate N-acetyltransferase GlmU n=1 Tax=Kocuria sp. TaxID=1871328 RepID=UPI0026E0C3DC|nr:bifunctional UDP-N-acetylglucosamine diphosphorylase/glucosamine-1-phosphate N-acetyltransferase GlmU [Kocuria sp.]MDO5368402.1 bifunctional UDP-N-acetylglucosamine diphosphorylase/glucosamine-1-phosphate N-acetyltransferase GlmU [Kocuria sp.]
MSIVDTAADQSAATGGSNPAAIIVLAAGKGTRMKSKTPKILHEIGGRSMVGHALKVARELHPEQLVAVIRHQRDLVEEHINSLDADVLIADQSDVPGTGSAVDAGLDVLDRETPVAGTVVVTYGDVPLLTAQTLQGFVAYHRDHGNAVTVLTADHPTPGKYGRILRDENGQLAEIKEFKDATEQERAVVEVNSGIFAFDAAVLRDSLARVDTDNAQAEKYLTDVPKLARAAGHRVDALKMADFMELEGANDREQLCELGAYLNQRTLKMHMANGVTVVDPRSTWIDDTVEIEQDVTILPGTQLHGTTRIAEDAVVGPDTTLTNVTVGNGATVIRTHGSDAELGAGASVGPFAYLRPGTVLGAKGKIGTFVETKNSTIGEGSKIPHLSYVGDATIGEHSNIGAASVFVNYDGVSKHRTVVGNHVRMGSDNMYVAPVSIGDGAYSGAGTTIRKDVPAGALALTEGNQVIVEGWVPKHRPGTDAARAAEAANGSQDSDHGSQA